MITVNVNANSTLSVTYTATDADGDSVSRTVNFTASAVISAPGAPTNVSASGGDRRFAVNWGVPGNTGTYPVTRYDMRYRVGNSGSWTTQTNIGNASARSYTKTSLAQGTTYQIQVRAVSSGGGNTYIGTWSASVSATTDSAIGAPSTPAAPTVSVSDNDLTITWTAPANNGAAITSYDIRYAPSGSGWTVLADIWSSGALSYTILNLTRGVEYSVQVRAENSVGTSGWSASGTGTPAVVAPTAPQSVTLTPSDDAIQVSWSAPSDNGGAAITAHDVRYRAGESGDWTVIDTATTTARKYTVTGLSNGTSYQVQVRAVNSAGDGAWSSALSETPSAGEIIVNITLPEEEEDPVYTPPSKVVIERVDSGDSTLTAHWSQPSNEGDFEVAWYDLRIRSGAEYTLIEQAVGDESTPSHTIHGLANDVDYDIQVRAVSETDRGVALVGMWSNIYTTQPEIAKSVAVGIIKVLNHDAIVWGISATGVLYNTFDLSDNWQEFARIPAHETPVTGMLVHRDTRGDPAIYAVTETGVWVLDRDNGVFLQLDILFPRDSVNGLGFVVWRGDLYISTGMTVYRYQVGSPAVLTVVGPNKDGGYPYEGKQHIHKLIDSNNSLLAIVQNDEVSDPVGTSQVLSYNGTGWWSMWKPDEYLVMHDMVVGSVLGEYTSFVSHGAVSSVDLYPDVHNPSLLNPGRRYQLSG